MIIISMQLITVLLCLAILATVQTKRYNASLKEWSFTIENETQQYSANIPSTLSLDLVDNGIIKDPYFRDNFLKYYNY